MFFPELPQNFSHDFSHGMEPFAEEIAMAATVKVIESTVLPGEAEPIPLVCRQGFINYQNASTRYSQRIANLTWSILGKCMPGTTAAAENALEFSRKGAPDLSLFGDVNPKTGELIGFYSVTFATLVSVVVREHTKIPRLRDTGVSFLQGLAQVVALQHETLNQ